MAILGKCDTTEHTRNTSPLHIRRTHERYYYYYLLLLYSIIITTKDKKY